MPSKIVNAISAHRFDIRRSDQIVEVSFLTDDGDARVVGLSKSEALDALTSTQRTTLFAIMDAWSAAAHSKDGFG